MAIITKVPTSTTALAIHGFMAKHRSLFVLRMQSHQGLSGQPCALTRRSVIPHVRRSGAARGWTHAKHKPISDQRRTAFSGE